MLVQLGRSSRLSTSQNLTPWVHATSVNLLLAGVRGKTSRGTALPSGAPSKCPELSEWPRIEGDENFREVVDTVVFG